MRKILVFVLTIALSVPSFSQDKKKNYNFTNKSADHVMIQLSSDHWLGLPDSVKDHVKGLSRGFNAYGMINKQFKGSPKLSVAFGLGIGNSNIFFKRMFVDIAATTRTLPFINQDSTQHYKKFKVSTTYLEVPVEFRFTNDPENPNKSVKFAIGAKAGTLLNAHNKAKELRNAAGNVINGAITKQSSKSYFNSTRLVATARVGYGIFSLFGAYGFSPMFKDGVAAPDVKPLQVGITVSGL